MQGGGGKSTQDTTADPWSGVQSYLADLFKRSSAQSQKSESYYPGQTYANIDPSSQKYYDLASQRALNPTAEQAASGNYYKDVLSGKYLGEKNPYMNKITQDMTDTIGASVGSRFANSGGYMGSPGEVQQVAGEVSKAVAPYQFQTYNTERGLQGDAAKQSLVLDQIRKGDLSGLLEAGKAKEGQQQAGMNEAVQRWNYNQQAPWDVLQKYSNMLQPGMQFGSQSSTSKTGQSTDWGAVAGGGIGAIGSLALLALLL